MQTIILAVNKAKDIISIPYHGLINHPKAVKLTLPEAKELILRLQSVLQYIESSKKDIPNE